MLSLVLCLLSYGQGMSCWCTVRYIRGSYWEKGISRTRFLKGFWGGVQRSATCRGWRTQLGCP
nr:hypothetical protein Iba_chr11bCG1890 [Ipomoea batatas]